METGERAGGTEFGAARGASIRIGTVKAVGQAGSGHEEEVRRASTGLGPPFVGRCRSDGCLWLQARNRYRRLKSAVRQSDPVAHTGRDSETNKQTNKRRKTKRTLQVSRTSPAIGVGVCEGGGKIGRGVQSEFWSRRCIAPQPSGSSASLVRSALRFQSPPDRLRLDGTGI